MDQNLEDPAEEELKPSERVFGNVEMLDMILKLLDQATLMIARKVCKQWREVSNISMKRRLEVLKPEYPRGRYCSRYRPDSRDQVYHVGPKLDHYQRSVVMIRDNWHRKKKGLNLSSKHAHLKLTEKVEVVGMHDEDDDPWCYIATAPVLAVVLTLDWIDSVTQLTFDETFKVLEWNNVGLIVLGKFKSLKTLSLAIPKNNTDNTVPLCFAEMLNAESANLQDLSFSCLKNLNVHVAQAQTVCEFPGFDLLQKSPALEKFYLDLDYEMDKDEHLQLQLHRRYNGPITYYLACKVSEVYEYQFTTAVRHFKGRCRGQKMAETRVYLEERTLRNDYNRETSFEIQKRVSHLKNLTVTLDGNEITRAPVLKSRKRNATQSLGAMDVQQISAQLVSPESRHATRELEFGSSEKDNAICIPYSVSSAFLAKYPKLQAVVFSTIGRSRDARLCRRDLRSNWWSSTLGGIKKEWIYSEMESSYDSKNDDPLGLTSIMNPFTTDMIGSLPPTEMSTSLPLDVLAQMLSAVKADVALETLTLSFWLWGLPVPADKKSIERATVFSTVKKLNWTVERFRRRSQHLKSDNMEERIAKGSAFENVTTFIFWLNLRGNDDWKPLTRQVQLNLHKMTPNARILMTSFLRTYRKPEDEGMEEVVDPNTLTAALQVAKSFDKLQHLVLAAKDHFDWAESLSKNELDCLEGLSSLTIIIRSDTDRMKKRYTRLFVEACTVVPSIQKLNVYYPAYLEDEDDADKIVEESNEDKNARKERGEGYEDREADQNDKNEGNGDERNQEEGFDDIGTDDEETDESDEGSSGKSYDQKSTDDESDPIEFNPFDDVGVEENEGNLEINYRGITRINDHLTVTCGPIFELQGKAVFDGIENSHVTWEEILKFALQRPKGQMYKDYDIIRY